MGTIEAMAKYINSFPSLKGMSLKEAAITIGILVLFSALVLVTIDAFYERPKYEDFCSPYGPERFPTKAQLPDEECDVDYSKENECSMQGGFARYEIDESGCRYFTECDFCNKDFDEANKKYNDTMFVILAIIGAIAIIFGVYYKIEFLGTGFMFSGIFLMFFGTVQNFSQFNKFIRVIVVALELGLVIFIAYKKVISKDTKPEKKR
jgi:hypothetical protein